MTSSPAACTHLIIAGGGHAHIGVLRDLARRGPSCDLYVTLVTPESTLAYSGMLPAHVAGHYRYDEMAVDLAALAHAAGARFVCNTLAAIAADDRVVTLSDGQRLTYDLLSLDIGSAPAELVRDQPDRVIPVKPVSRLMTGITEFEQSRQGLAEPAHVVVIGSGAGGIELMLSLAHRFASWAVPPRLSLVSRSAGLLSTRAGSAGRRLQHALDRAGVNIVTGHGVERITDDAVMLDNGRVIAADIVFAATGANPPSWLGACGLGVDDRGFIQVDWMLQSRTHAGVFAAGDIAALPEARPKSGVFAVREAPVLSANLLNQRSGKALRTLRAPRTALALISLGERRAIAVRGCFSLPASRLMWWLKDWIDRRFIQRFNPPF